MASVWRSLLHSTRVLNSHVQLSSPPPTAAFRPSVVFSSCQNVSFPKLTDLSSSSCYHHRYPPTTAKTSPGSDGLVVAEDYPEDGVSLGTMKLPSDTDLQRFESLLFQWANSLCQGANLPLPVPLKVDKIAGGVRLGFITIDDGKTEVLVYIDCLVFPAVEGSGPIFRAIRNGAMKDQPPPGEARIMRSLLQALQMSVEIAKL